MMSFKENAVKKIMKTLGSVALFLGAIAITPTSFMSTHQPKCPDEFLK